MPSKNFNRMLALGEWLEDFLSPETTREQSWKIEKIFKKAKILLDIETSNDAEKIKDNKDLIFSFQKSFLGLFIKIADSELPWSKAFVDLEERKPYSIDLRRLKDSYATLSDRMIIKDGEYAKVRGISYSGGGYGSHSYEFAFQSMAAHIFFEFLMISGQEYYLFCQHCGRFTVIRRKGRKKFCSDICRTNHGREN